MLKSTYEESCYFFYWDRDMNARIPYCNKSGAIDPQNCNKKCPNYISHSQATMVINQHLAARQEVENHWKNVGSCDDDGGCRLMRAESHEKDLRSSVRSDAVDCDDGSGTGQGVLFRSHRTRATVCRP